MKLTLVENWTSIWKWYSTHAMVIYTTLMAYYVQLSPAQKAEYPDWVIYCVMGVMCISFVVGRIVKQESTTA